MSKKRYAFDFIITNEVAVKRIGLSLFLSNHVTNISDDNSVVTISMTDLKAKDVLNEALHMSSEIRSVCCFAVDGSPIPGTKKFSYTLAECMDELFWCIKNRDPSERITTKGFKEWLKESLRNCKRNEMLRGHNDFDPYRVKIFPYDYIPAQDEIGFCVGYYSKEEDQSNG